MAIDVLEELGLAIVRWTVRLAVACYAGRVWLDVADLGTLRTRRVVWTIGAVLYFAHVAAAFHFVHGWSHADAWRSIEEQTARLVGWESGAGLWANYFFTALWMTDVTAWWLVGRDYPWRHRRVYAFVQMVFAFLMFNATAVFGPAYWRPAVSAFGILLALGLLRRARRSSTRRRSAKSAPSPRLSGL